MAKFENGQKNSGLSVPDFKIQATMFISALTSPILHGISSVGGLTEKVSNGQNILGWMELSKNWPSSKAAS